MNQPQIKVQSAYWSKRKTKSIYEWRSFIEAKRREINFGTHHNIVE